LVYKFYRMDNKKPLEISSGFLFFLFL